MSLFPFRKSALLLTAAGVLASGPESQGATVEDFQTWGSVIATGGFGALDPDLKNLRWWLEGQGRFGNDSSRFSQGLLRTGVGYAFNEHGSLWLGYGFIATEEPFAAQSFDEHRLWQQFLWNKSTPIGTFSSRSRLEQRFAENGAKVGWRFRQLFKLSYPLAFAPDLSLVLSEEYFVHINSTDWGPRDGFDQNRVFAGIGYNLTQHLRTEIGYMNQYIHRIQAPDRMDHNLSLNLFLNY